MFNTTLPTKPSTSTSIDLGSPPAPTNRRPGGSTTSTPGPSHERATIEGAPPSFQNRPASVASGASGRRRASLQETTAPAPTTTVESPEQRTAREQGVRNAVTGYFTPHMTDGEDSNRDAFNAMIDSRVTGLMDMGESEASIKETFSKGNKMDYAAEGGRGFVGSIPFGVMSRVLDTQPVLGDTLVAGLNHLSLVKHAPDSFKGGAAAGLASGVADHIGSQALGPAMKNNQWLASTAEDLEGPMVGAKKAAEQGLGKAVWQNGAAIQTFTARNVVRGIVGPALTAAGHVAGAVQTDSWLAAAGSPLAGAGFNMANRYFAAQDHRVGPEYLLGRTDWRDQYTALKEATWKGAAANGAGRLAKAGVNLVDATLSTPHTITSATGLTTNVGALGGGLGLVSMATTGAGALAKKMGAGPAGVVAAEHAGRTASSALVFPSWTTAAVVTDPAVGAMRKASEAIGDMAQTGMTKGTHATLKGGEKAAVETANYAGPKLAAARDGIVDMGTATMEGVSSFSSAVSTRAGELRTAAGERAPELRASAGTMIDDLATGVANLRRRTPATGTQPAAANTQPVQNIAMNNLNP
jgi:hypothetical protein